MGTRRAVARVRMKKGENSGEGAAAPAHRDTRDTNSKHRACFLGERVVLHIGLVARGASKHGNIQKGLNNFNLKAKARMCP